VEVAHGLVSFLSRCGSAGECVGHAACVIPPPCPSQIGSPVRFEGVAAGFVNCMVEMSEELIEGLMVSKFLIAPRYR
jgi:hypothetical protein